MLGLAGRCGPGHALNSRLQSEISQPNAVGNASAEEDLVHVPLDGVARRLVDRALG